MFYKMIENARDRWYASPECTMAAIIDYIESRGMLCDAQIAAIKTYLFLKVSCESRPLVDLFCEGKFNTLELDSVEISNTVRKYLGRNAAAAELFGLVAVTNAEKVILTAFRKKADKLRCLMKVMMKDRQANELRNSVVKISEIADSNRIIEKGVQEFLDSYKGTVYDGSLTAKLGIYCRSIEKLVEMVYPLVSRIVAEYGMNNDMILNFTKGINSILSHQIVRCTSARLVHLCQK